MSTADVRIFDPGGLNSVPTYQWQTKAGNTAVNPGEPVKTDTANGRQYVKIIADADGTTGDSLVGIVKSTDTVKAGSDGVVDVYVPVPGVIYAARCKVGTNCNTNAKILALVGKRVIWDLTANLVTIDTAAADSATNAIRIVGGDSTQNTVYFTIAASGTFLATIASN